MTSAWLMCDNCDLAVAERLGAELSHTGLAVAGMGPLRPSEAADAVVVLLSSAASLPSESLKAARDWDDRLVPVSVDGDIHPEFSEANQILLPVVGEPAAARQIAAVAALGGRNLTRLRELFAATEDWARTRDKNDLLGTRDLVDSARALVAACPLDLSHPLAAAYVDASARRLQHQSRLFTVVGAMVALVLVATTVLALVQRNSSATAAAQLDREAKKQTSERLASLGRTLLDLDPDMARIAAIEALEQNAGTAAAATARELLVQSLGHRSFRLDVLARDVTVGGEVFAIADVDGDAQLRDAETGDLLRAFDLTTDITDVELSVDGAHLALLGPDGFQVVSSATGVEELSGSATFAVWAGDTLISLEGGALDSHDLGGGASELNLPKTKSPIDSFSFNADVSLIATIAGDEVSVTSLPDGSAGWTGAAAGATDVQFASTGELFLVGSKQWSMVADPLDTGSQSTGAGISGLPLVRPLTEAGLVAVGTDSGEFSLVYGFENAYSSPAVLAGRAHMGTAIALATIPGGGFATAGGDRYVRLWDEPNLPSGAAGGSFAEYWPRVDPANREGYRPVLALSPDESIISVSQGSPVLVSRIDVETMMLAEADREAAKYSQFYLGDIVSRARPCGNDGVFFFAQASGSSEVLDLVTGVEDVLPDITDPAPGGVITAHLGCTPDGSQVGWADSSSVRFLDRQAGSWRSTPVNHDAMPVAVLAAAAPVSVALRNGDRLSPHGARSRLTPTGVGILAAGDSAGASADRLFVAIAADGGIYASTPVTEPLLIGAVPQDMEAYAIRVSPDGQLTAVIGNRTTEIYDTHTGDLYLSMTRGANDYRESIRDVLFVGDNIVTVDAVGALTRHEVPPVSQLLEALRPAPREPTANEQDLVLRIER